jgi:hypothetical protein
VTAAKNYKYHSILPKYRRKRKIMIDKITTVILGKMLLLLVMPRGT